MGRWHDLIAMLAERRIGFKIDEQMKGTHRYLRDFAPGKVAAGQELPLSFEATWGNPRLERFLNPWSEDFCFNVMEGRVSAGGLGLDLPMKGSLELRYHRDASIRYHFEFEAHGRRMRYEGAKTEIRPWNLHRTHTICRGTIEELDGGGVLSDSVVRFDLRALPDLLLSLRPG